MLHARFLIPSKCTAGLLTAVIACGLAPTARAQFGPTRVVVVPVEKRAVPVTLTLVGTVRPDVRSLIASEVAGIVEEMPVRQGDRIEKGTVICRLRDTVRRLTMEQAEGTLAQLQAELAELQAGTRKEEIEEARAAMEEARAILAKWDLELERVEELRERASASLKEYNDTVSEHAAAKQRLAQTTAAYDKAVAGPRKEVIERARFAVDTQRVLVDRLKYDLEQSVIRAPFTGYVTVKHTEVGQWLMAGGNVVELIDLGKVLVRVDVPESAILAAKVGETAQVIVEALGTTLAGVIRHVIPQADEKARTFPVEIELPNESRELKSGMFVRAVVPAGPTSESLVVPRDAVLQRGPSHFVVVVGPSPTGEGQMATPMPVQLGAGVGAWVAVNSPVLEPGTPVAVKGHDRVYVPMPVEPVPGQAMPLPAGPASVPASQPAETPLAGLPQAATGG